MDANKLSRVVGDNVAGIQSVFVPETRKIYKEFPVLMSFSLFFYENRVTKFPKIISISIYPFARSRPAQRVIRDCLSFSLRSFINSSFHNAATVWLPWPLVLSLNGSTIAQRFQKALQIRRGGVATFVENRICDSSKIQQCLNLTRLPFTPRAFRTNHLAIDIGQPEGDVSLLTQALSP